MQGQIGAFPNARSNGGIPHAGRSGDPRGEPRHASASRREEEELGRLLQLGSRSVAAIACCDHRHQRSEAFVL
jgi:hypothetical protein